MSRQKKGDPIAELRIRIVDYKDEKLLGRFISERGKILPRRLTGLSAWLMNAMAEHHQRERQHDGKGRLQAAEREAAHRRTAGKCEYAATRNAAAQAVACQPATAQEGAGDVGKRVPQHHQPVLRL